MNLKRFDPFQKSFRRRLMAGFIAVSVVPIVITGLMSVQLFRMKVTRDYAAADRIEAEDLNSKVETLLAGSAETIRTLKDSQTIHGMLTGHEESARLIYRELYTASTPIRGYATVEIFSGDTCVYSNEYAEIGKVRKLDFGILRKAAEHPGEPVYLAETQSSGLERTLLVAEEVVEENTPGFIVISIGPDDLDKLTGVQLGSRDQYCIVNHFFEPIYVSGEGDELTDVSLIRANMLRGSAYGSGIDNNVYVSKLAGSDLYGIYITPLVVDPSVMTEMMRMILILGVISFVVCLIMSAKFRDSISKPLMQLSTAMKAVRHGDFDARVDMEREDELGQIEEGFNRMAGELGDMMKEKVEQQRAIDRIQTEMIQEQLNPHFLYNTLDTIKWLAKSRGIPEVASLSSKLAKILRQSISTKQFCTLSDELDLLDSYCDIQSVRFNDRFIFDVQVEEEILDAIVPKMILQPIVENAVLHGVQDLDDGKIVVQAERIDEILQIRVSDNGVGISDEMMEKINAHDAAKLSGHLGVKNVDQVIRINYGLAYGVHAQRAESGGTMITITLPYSTTVPAGAENGNS